MRKNVLLVSVFLIMSIFCGCSADSDAKLFTAKADEALENRNYQEALDYYAKAYETTNATNRVNALCEILTSYLDAKAAYDVGDYTKAFDIIDNLEYDYNPYSPINEDIRKLISETQGKTTADDKIENALDALAKYIGENDFEKAYEVINELESYTLDHSQADEFEYQLKRMKRKQEAAEKQPTDDATEKQKKNAEDDEPFESADESKEADDDWYRVRKSWDDSETQLSAFKSLENAKKEVDKNPGYKVFDSNGRVVYE